MKERAIGKSFLAP